MDAYRKGHLPRLAPEHYRGRAFIHWTLTIEDRATGWLTPTFHSSWQLGLLHTCARYELVCPTYVLMPDHIHLLLLGVGIDDGHSDQRVAIEFLRKNLRRSLAPWDWQHQAHDHVLREAQREWAAFTTIASYIRDNPVRAALASKAEDYPYSGCCIPGYSDLAVWGEHYWELFWRIYNRLLDSHTATRSRS